MYNTEEGLDDLDWDTIRSKRWFDSEEDPDRKRRKQAELLVHQEIPIEAIHAIGVYNQNAQAIVYNILSKFDAGFEAIVFNNGYY
ncbi:MAG TPA: DUF4433 domain-containing protein [Bacteroides sp.]|nr:DUF4433 domain-containing protein [Bacteroides sp.]